MKISHTKGRGKKIHLLLDDEYQITTDIDFWAEHYFKDGTEITQEEWESLTDSIYYKKAVDKCYDLLSRRDHSVKELKTKLLRTVDEKNADKAIEKMLELGYLDDEKYARNLVKYLAQTRNMSKNHIKQEMFKRGIPNEIIIELKKSLDCNLSFFGNNISINNMYLIMITTIIVLLIIYILQNKLKKNI